MSADKSRSARGVRFILLSVCLISSAFIATWAHRDGVSVGLANEVRELSKQRLGITRMVAVLKDFKAVVKAVQEEPMTVEQLTVRIIEMFTLAAADLNVDVNTLTVSDSASASSSLVMQTDDRAPERLRVEMSLSMLRAIDLLTLFDSVREAGAWRPIEVRACALSKQLTGQSLSVACSIDVYYFEGVGA